MNEKEMLHDGRLLSDYTKNRSESAFAQLVSRHSKLVYSTCRRDLSDPQIAEDCTQAVFVILAQKANSLRVNSSLAGWLFCTARHVTSNAIKAERRRIQKEEVLMQQAQHEASYCEPQWQWTEPRLHDALAKLTQPDRDAILLRFYDEFSLGEIGQQLSISEEAARKRVSRALDKLRTVLCKGTHVVLSAAVLHALLSENAAHAVPASLTASLHQIIVHSTGQLNAAGKSSPVYSIVKGTLLVMLKTKIIGAAVAVALILILGGSVLYYKAHKAESSVSYSPALAQWYASVGANADPASLAKKQALDDITALENTEMEARKSKDVNRLFASVSPNFTLIMPGGQIQTCAQVKQGDQIAFALSVSDSVNLQNQSIILTGNHADIPVESISKMKLKNPKTSATVELDQDMIGVMGWDKINGQWLYTRFTLTNDKATANGKPVPVS